jgi:hypothetical protein
VTEHDKVLHLRKPAEPEKSLRIIKQQFSKGRSRAVVVERARSGAQSIRQNALQDSRQETPEERSPATKLKKSRPKKVADKSTTERKPKRERKRRKAGKRFRKKSGTPAFLNPAFLNSMSNTFQREVSPESKPLRQTKGGRRTAGATARIGSAGLPGNEESDPPRRASLSTAADRYKALFRAK